MVSKNCPMIGEHVVTIFVTQEVIIAIVWPAKNTINYSFRGLLFKNGMVNCFLCYQILISMIRRNFWQSLKNILFIGFRVPLNFQKFKVASYHAYQNLII